MAGDQKKFRAAMAQAEQLSQQNSWTDAAKAYRFALAEFSNNEAAVLGFGRASLFSGQIETAKQAFEHALRVNPANHQALTHMADLHERMGQLDAAAESYLRAGNIASSQNNLDTAIDFWLRATKLVSGHIEAHRNLADALTKQGETLRAARHWLTLAAIYQRRDDRDMAVQQIQQAEQLLHDDVGIAAAYEALQNNAPIQPDKVGEAAPSTAPAFDLPDMPDEMSFDDDLFEDPFALDDFEATHTTSGGLVEGAQQDALTEMANLIFEEEGNPNTLLIMQAIELQRQQDTGQAADNFRQALDSGFNKPSLCFNLGLLYKDLGQFDESAKLLQLSGRDDRFALCSQFALADAYYAANKTDLAVRNFIEVVKTLDLQTVSGDQTSQVLHQYEGLADKYLTQSDTKKIDDFVEALKNFFADPDWERNVYIARKRMENVSDDGAMSLAEYLETPQAAAIINAMDLTGEYLKRNQVMTASEECLFAIQKAPFYLPLHIRLADILLKQEKTDRAIEKYLYVAKVYEMRNLPDQVVNVYQRILRLAPMDVTVRSKLIDLYTSLQNTEKALDQYLILADSYYQLAQVDRSLEKYSEAARLAASVDNANNWRMEILKRMGDIYNQRFDWSKATAAYEELVQIDPNNERAQRELIDLYFKQNKRDEAVAKLDNLLAIYQRENPRKSVDVLRELVSVYPDDMGLRQRLAVAYVQNGMNKEAIAEYDALGEMQLEHGLRDQAVRTIQAILNLGPDDPEGYQRLLSKIKGGG